MYEVQPRQVDIALVIACHDGNFEEVKRLVEDEDADICYQVCYSPFPMSITLMNFCLHPYLRYFSCGNVAFGLRTFLFKSYSY